MSDLKPLLDDKETAMIVLYVSATPAGKLDFVESKKLLSEIAAATATLVSYEIFLDVRGAQSVMSVADQWFLAEDLVSHIESFSRKMAVLCRGEQYDNKSFFALCAKNRGFKVRAFTSFEHAFEWLVSKVPDA